LEVTKAVELSGVHLVGAGGAHKVWRSVRKGKAVPESLDWGFRPEIGLSDPPEATADVGELHQFANTLHGDRVWGDDRAVAAVTEQVMQKLRARVPCTSVLKLRTALFWLARTSRRTDEVGASLMPEEAMYEPEMRALLMQLRECMASGSADLGRFTQAIHGAAAAIPVDGHFVESDLRDAIAAEMALIAESSLSQVPLAVTEVNMGRLPGWDPSDPPGKFDIAVGPADRGRLAREATLLAEVKWSDHNTLAHSLWDVAKLIAGLACCADHVMLVGGWPTRIWDRAPCAALYRPGVVDYADFVRLPGEWRHSIGTAKAERLPFPASCALASSRPHRSCAVMRPGSYERSRSSRRRLAGCGSTTASSAERSP
jgi:hypothetical protein